MLFRPKSNIDICSDVRLKTKPAEYLNSSDGTFIEELPVEITDKKCVACRAEARMSALEPRLVVKSTIPCSVIRL